MFKKIIEMFKKTPVFKRILVFENYEKLEDIFKCELEKHFVVKEADSHINFKEIKKFKPHLIILSYNTNFDGVEFLNKIKKLRIKFKTIFRTFYDDENIINYISNHCKIPKERILNQDLSGPEFCKILRKI